MKKPSDGSKVSIKIYLGVGSNLGDRTAFLEKARARIEKLPGTQFLRSSSVFETDPVGGPPQGKYLNAVWEIETDLEPRALKDGLKQIEGALGRKSPFPNAPREIDLDILFYGDRMVREKGLEIPHPRLHERGFVLEPLAQLVPETIHPVLKQSIKNLWQKHRENLR